LCARHAVSAFTATTVTFCVLGGLLSGSLVGASPEGPCNDGSGFDLALRQARSNTGDFLHRPADQHRFLRVIRRLHLGETAVLVLRIVASIEGQHDERNVLMPAVPGAGLVVVEPQFVLGRLESILDGPALSDGVWSKPHLPPFLDTITLRDGRQCSYRWLPARDPIYLGVRLVDPATWEQHFAYR
jgi:hypothetical protein